MLIFRKYIVLNILFFFFLFGFFFCFLFPAYLLFISLFLCWHTLTLCIPGAGFPTYLAYYRYVHSCLELVVLIKIRTNNLSQKWVVLESSVKPCLGCQFSGCKPPTSDLPFWHFWGKKYLKYWNLFHWNVFRGCNNQIFFKLFIQSWAGFMG